MTNQRSGHPAEERIQEYLDGRLSAEERQAVRAHLDHCAGCRAEVEAWRSVFARLDRMPELAPSADFAERVMDALPAPEPLPARIRDWLRGLLPDVGGARERHPGPELVLSYLDGALAERRSSRLEAHLEGCTACRAEVGEWRRVFRALDEIGRFAPPEGFADVVLSRVGTAREAVRRPEPRSAGRLAGWIEGLRPRTWKGWAVAGGVAAAPAVAMVAGVLALFSHPLLTPSNLGAFLWWQISGAARTLLSGATQSLMESPLLFQIWEAVLTVAGSPETLGIGALAFSAATLTAVWILYRYLISEPLPGRGYANA